MRVAFLFDNDGVLIDSSALHWASWERLMEEELELKAMDHTLFTQTFGMRNDLILQKIVPQIPEEKRHALAERKEVLFRELAAGKVQLLPGIEPFLQEILASGLPHIIASSTPIENLEMYLESTVLGDYFEHYASAEEVEHGKPFPHIFVEAAKRLGFSPEECIVVEDAPAGIEAGKAAGCFVVAITTTHAKSALENYDLLYQTPAHLDLQEILEAYRLWKG